MVERMRFLKAYVGDRPLPGSDFRSFAREILVAGQKVMKRDIRRAAKNSFKRSSKIGRLFHRGARCYYRKRYLKEKKYSGPDIRAIIDEIFKLDFKLKGTRDAWSALNSLLKIDLPTLFPVALIERKNQKLMDYIVVEFDGPPIFQKKLGRIQILKGSLPDGHLKRIKSGIKNFRKESYLKENWFIIGCKTNSARECFYLSPGKVPV